MRTVLLLLLSAACFAQKPAVTPAVAATYSATLEPTSVVWSPDGQSFAFVEQGKLRLYRNGQEDTLVTLASLPAKEPKETQPFSWTNRGVAEKPLQWIPGRQSLLVKARGDLFEVPLDGGVPTQLTATEADERDPKVSPDGRTIAYGLAHDLYVMDLATKRSTRLTRDGSATRLNGEPDWVYPEELALESAYWWSPDSRSLAFLQFDTSAVLLYPQADLTGLRPVSEPERFPQAGTPNSKVRLGLIARTGGLVRWLDTGAAPDDLLARVDWMPDSQSLLLRRLTRTQQRLTLARISAAGGKPATILEESDNASWVNLRDDFALIDDGHAFLWGSERSGYRHLYVYSIDGKLERQLTSGNWEVTDINCVNADWVYYTSTESSPVDRHLYRLRLAGRGLESLTNRPGWTDASLSPGCAQRLDWHSSLTAPPTIELNGKPFRKPHANALDHAFSEPELTTFRGADGTEFHARLTKPANFDAARKYPAIVMVYGGPHAQRVRNQWRGADLDQALAAKGFVIWEIDNRGTAGRGHVFETPLAQRFGKQELADQVEGVRHLISLGFVDASRIGVHGWSYGGFMTLTALLEAPDVFKAGIAGAPVTDWRNYDTIYTERYLGLPSENEAGYRASSPLHSADKLQGKLMIIHNFEDDNVLLQHTMRMSDALQQAGKRFELQLYTQKTHHVSGPVRAQMYETMVDFFERTLNPAQ